MKINQPEANNIVHRMLAEHCIAVASDPTSFVYVDEAGKPRPFLVVERFQRALRGCMSTHRKRDKSYSGVTNDLGTRADELLERSQVTR